MLLDEFLFASFSVVCFLTSSSLVVVSSAMTLTEYLGSSQRGRRGRLAILLYADGMQMKNAALATGLRLEGVKAVIMKYRTRLRAEGVELGTQLWLRRHFVGLGLLSDFPLAPVGEVLVSSLDAADTA